ncbi:PLP-dependent aminotransferase family protein [Candidatus Leptofilum sp.]|uniref:MocR-like pyridoxine biosynthesis transcription factor PdxR n=1 Tax=Candidatus Leptofilum sp. TaxID=3241576 RepID=UPI003B5A3087
MLNLTVNRDSKPPLYRQIAEQIKTQISNGRLPANSRLPTVRSLARTLGVTRLTVQNAYAELQADGWVEATVGRGTFVSTAVQQMSLQPTVGQFLTPDSAINDMLAINQVIGVRSMAMAHADPSLFPTEAFWQQMERLRPQANNLLSYGPIQGDAALRLAIVQLLHEDGIEATPDDILVTSGAMQSISLAAQAIAQPGDMVLVEQPTFLGVLNVLKAQGLRPLHLPVQPDGPDPAQMEQLIQTHRPRLFYTVANHHNPTGFTTSPAKRQAILKLAQRHNLLIIEDDIYGKLGFAGPPPPSYKQQDDDDRVLYLSSFSKILMPGLRVGYLLMPTAWRDQLLTLRRATDLCGTGLLQRALAHFLQEGGLKKHLRRVLPIYQERRDALLNSLQRWMPTAVRWSEPQGGFSCWVSLPHYAPPGVLYYQALQNGFAFTPGEAYMLEEKGREYLRLCFGNLGTEGIEAGVKLLGSLIQQQLTSRTTGGDWLPYV